MKSVEPKNIVPFSSFNLGCQCNDKCSTSLGFFNEEPFCDVSSDSSCPDLTHYTWDVVHSVSAEACKKFPNNYGKTLCFVTIKKSVDDSKYS